MHIWGKGKHVCAESEMILGYNLCMLQMCEIVKDAGYNRS